MTAGAIVDRVRHARPETLAVLAIGLGAIVIHAAIYLPFLPEADGTGGADYSYFLPQLLAGYYWFHQNGAFAIPWFTPAFCAGVPYYPNMQALYFSVPQFLTFAIGPVLALQMSFVGFAAAGYFGFYTLLRRSFAVGPWMALAGGVLFLFNTFYSARFVVGHLAFHAYMLTPIVAIAALAGAGRRPMKLFDGWVLAGALVVAYMVQAGMVHALIPAMLSVAVTVLIHFWLFGVRWMAFGRLVVMAAITVLLSAAKLVAGIAFLSNFSRQMIPLSGFGELWQSLVIALQSLFIAPADVFGFLWIQNNQWFPDTKIHLAYHEFEYGVTLIPAVIILAWLAARAVAAARGRPAVSLTPAKTAICLVIAAVLTLPILLNWYHPAWTGLLQRTPVLGNSSTLIRWVCIYIPLVILAAVLIVARAPSLARALPYCALAIVVGVIWTNATHDRGYYERRGNYRFATVADAYAAVAAGAPVPTVGRIAWPDIDPRDLMSRRDRNERMVRGATNPNCYEPMFGHRLEEYPFGPLREGPTLEARNGRLNIKNPACMVYPEANQCRPGDHFTEDQIWAARDFVNYRAFRFELPWWQTLANRISLASLLAVAAGFVFLGFVRMRRAIAATPSRTGETRTDP